VFGRPEPLLKHKIEWLPIGIDTRDPMFESLTHPNPKDWSDLYVRLFEKNLPKWQEFLKVISSANEPILYGCLFGKDRTGIATSLLLDLLDVHDELIAKDYAKTSNEIIPLGKKFRFMWDDRPATDEEIFQHYLRSPEEVILAFLECVRTHPETSPVGQLMTELRATHKEKLKSRLLK
jgi:hypothetical protein